MMPLKLLLILASAAVSAVYATYLPLHVLLVVAFFAGAVAVISRVSPPPDPAASDRMDVEGGERDLGLGAYSGALAIGGLALLIAFIQPAVALVLLGIGAVWVVAWWPRWLRTERVRFSIVIDRELSAVYAFIGNPENEPRWSDITEHVEKLTPGPISVGSRYSGRARVPMPLGMPERVFEGVEEIIEYEPNHRVKSMVTSPPGFNFDLKTFAATPNGTLVTHHIECAYSYVTAVTGCSLLFGPSTNRLARAKRDAGWARTKEILESHTDQTP